MISLEIATDRMRSAIVRGVDASKRAVAEALDKGISKASVDLASDVAAHTPVRSGLARRSVQAVPHRYVDGGQVIKYDYSIAYYMRFLLIGAQAHRIYPKYQSGKGYRQALRRREKEGRSTEDLQPRDALSFSYRGSARFFAEVDHPGVKGRDLLGERLTANRGRVTATVAGQLHLFLGKTF